MKNFTKTIMVIIAGLIFSPASNAAAPDIAPQPCDTEYWKQMSARAWMEAEREIMQNQNLIFKPDSVLEYVCFDQFVNLAAHEGGKIFTHTDYFGQKIIGTDAEEGLPKSLTRVVYAALGQYVSNSFGHEYLGGRAGSMSITNKDSLFEPPSGPLAGGYVCNEMSSVWKAAKCSNFIDNTDFEDTDGFYPFKAIKGHNTPDVAGYDTIQDTREFPTSCRSGAGAATLGTAGTWQNQIDLANNVDGSNELYRFRAPLAAIYEEVGDKLEPGNCGQPSIATGITVYTSNDEGYLDGVCTNPGCVYEKGSPNEAGRCVAVE